MSLFAACRYFLTPPPGPASCRVPLKLPSTSSVTPLLPFPIGRFLGHHPTARSNSSNNSTSSKLFPFHLQFFQRHHLPCTCVVWASSYLCSPVPALSRLPLPWNSIFARATPVLDALRIDSTPAATVPWPELGRLQAGFAHARSIDMDQSPQNSIAPISTSIITIETKVDNFVPNFMPFVHPPSPAPRRNTSEFTGSLHREHISRIIRAVFGNLKEAGPGHSKMRRHIMVAKIC
ncbi:hypothetical protein KSP39_PZI009969 [Platanthera zijinensis]|uniref:Uncharacterized protein n=1 Tax=Platanthera zijinensis TaxID=2320716 RepID=A0AAP0G681_9ASPA